MSENSTKICLLCESVVCIHYSEKIDKLTEERDKLKHEFKMLQSCSERQYRSLEIALDALKKAGTMAANLTNGMTEYNGDGYGYILKECQAAIAQIESGK